MARQSRKNRCTEQTTIRLPKHLEDKLAALAAAGRITKGKVIRRLIARTRMGAVTPRPTRSPAAPAAASEVVGAVVE